MDIQSVVTKQEYNNIRSLSYEDFCAYARRFVKLCVEESLKALPTVVTHLSTQAAHLKEVSEEFYRNNPDLVSERKLVALSVEKVEGENPGMAYRDVLAKAAVLARSKISAKKLLMDSSKDKLPDYDERLNEL